MAKPFKTKKRENLETLTSKFINFIFQNNFSNLYINLKKISKELNIAKRRLYDLTNVLEGIGYLKKYRRNIMKITPEFINQITNLTFFL